MRCIADADVLLPVLVEGHVHQAPAAVWWGECNDGDVGLSLPVRMALLRLLSNSRIMGSSVLRPAQAAHARIWYDNVARREPSPDLWADTWLAALAQAHDIEMVTFDRGFRSHSKLKLRLLEPTAG